MQMQTQKVLKSGRCYQPCAKYLVSSRKTDIMSLVSVVVLGKTVLIGPGTFRQETSRRMRIMYSTCSIAIAKSINYLTLLTHTVRLNFATLAKKKDAKPGSKTTALAGGTRRGIKPKRQRMRRQVRRRIHLVVRSLKTARSSRLPPRHLP
jgi:hypothetical protein